MYSSSYGYYYINAAVYWMDCAHFIGYTVNVIALQLPDNCEYLQL